MRKFLSAIVIFALVLGIALLARPEVREDGAAPAPAPLAEAAREVAVPTAESAAAETTVTAVVPVSQTRRPTVATSKTARPVGPVPATLDDTAEEVGAQDGAAVLKRASAAYGRVKSLRADFVQVRDNPLLDSKTTSRGTLYQRSPDRFALKFTQPAGDVIIGDGSYFWIYYPSADKRQVIRADATPGGAGAVDLKSQFIGDPARKFSYTYFGTQRDGGRNVHVLNLVPRQQSGYKSLRVWIDAADYLVRHFQITEEAGSVVEFRLSNLSVNPTLGDEIFRFKPPAGAQVIER